MSLPLNAKWEYMHEVVPGSKVIVIIIVVVIIILIVIITIVIVPFAGIQAYRNPEEP